MFRPDAVERHLSRVRPGQVLAVWVPVLCWFLARSLRGGRVELAGGLLAGLALWTLLEYTLHRWVFHFAPSRGSERQQDVAFLIHGVHHDYPYDADRLVMPPPMAIAIGLAVGLPLRALVGPAWFPPVFAGLVGGYLWYDLTHYATHHRRPRTALGRMQRHNHLLHHFRMPERLFGVTIPFWDHVFGTHVRWARAPAHRPSGAGPIALSRGGAPR